MFSQLLDRVGSSSRRSRTAKSTANKKRARLNSMLGFQPLEDRRLLAVLDPIETVAIGTAYEDSNANGFRDAGEMGLNGVFVDLLNIDSGGVVIAGTADVDLNGDGSIDPAGETGVWQFANFSIGDQHDVRLIEAPGSAFTTAVPPVFQLDQPGAVVSRSGQASGFDLPELALLGSHNIGVAYEGSIHGLKFEDFNGNGSQDPGEPGLVNVTFELTGRDAFGVEVGPIQATTDANGAFEFVGLFPSVAGQVNPNGEFDVEGNLIAATGYTITELPTPGFAPTTPTVFTTDLLSGQELVWQSGAANLPAAPVALIDQVQLENEDAGSTVINQTLAAQIFQPDVTGNLLRVDLRLTAEVATFFLAPGAQPATGVRLEVQTIDQFGMPSGAAIGRADLTAEQVTAFLNSTEPLDGEIGLVSFDFSGAPLAMLEDADYALVLSGSQTLATTYRWAIDSTDPYDRGRALTSFDLGANYNEFNVPTDHAFRTVMIPFADPREEVVVGTPLVFGNVRPGSIHGLKFQDFNANGRLDLDLLEPLEPSQSGVQFTLSTPAGDPVFDASGQIVEPVTSGIEGDFAFEGLLPGEYVVTEILVEPFANVEPLARSFTVGTGQALVWTLGASQSDREEILIDPDENDIWDRLTWGNFLPGSIHGYKFEDVDNDGVDTGEPRLEGVTIELYGVVPGGPSRIVSSSDAPGGVSDDSFDLVLAAADPLQIEITVTSPVAGETPPLDLVFLQDLSSSFADDLPTVRGLVPDLVTELRTIQPDTRFGVSSFIDKPNVGTGGSNDFVYATDLGLTSDADAFQSTINGLTTRSGGDSPEAQLSGLLQTAVRPGEIGYRTGAARVVVLATDAPFHVAGRLSSLPPNNGDDVLDGDPPGSGEDYPSIEQVRTALLDAGVVPIFAVTSNRITLYESLVADLGFGTVVELSSDSSNLVTAITNGLSNLQSTLILSVEDDALGYVESISPASFTDVPEGESRTFTVTLSSAADATPGTVTLRALGGLGEATVTVNPPSTLALIATDVTDENGLYDFTRLRPGEYFVREIVPAGFQASTVTEYPITLTQGVELVALAGQSGLDANDPREEIVVFPELVFGNYVPGSISGFKFEDIDADGVFTPDVDMPLAGVTFVVEATLANGVFFTDQVTTDGNGRFDLTDLPPSIAGVGLATGYTLTETVPNGFLASTPTSLQFDLESGLALVFAVGASGIDPNDPLREEILADSTGDGIGDDLIFGNFVPGSFHGFKFEDVDADGFYDPNIDAPQSGVPFRLTDIEGNFVEDVFGNLVPGAISGDDGEFAFVNLVPGTYLVTEVLPAGFESTTPELSRMFTINSRQELAWAEGASGVNPENPLDPRVEIFIDPDANGIWEALVWGNTAPGSIHGFKFEDINGNGVLEDGETPLQGIEFRLEGTQNAGGLVTQTAFTDADGEFAFTGLFAGNYTVTEIVPEAYRSTTPTVREFIISSRQEYVWEFGAADLPGFDGDPRFEVIASDEPNATLGERLIFGNVVPGSIHGFKFLDADADGIFDEDTESGLAGIPFELTGVTFGGVEITPITVVTDADGEYDFENLLPGTYTVTELVPDFFPATTPISFTVDIFSGQEIVAIPGQSTPRFGVPSVDVDHPFSTGEVAATPTLLPGQTFTPTVSGPLTSISVQAAASPSVAAGTVTMSLHEIDETGNPVLTPFATAELPLSSVSDGPAASLQFDFPEGTLLEAATTYAFLITVAGGDGNGIALANSFENTYADGNGFIIQDGVLNQLLGSDLVFTTTMRERVNFEEVFGNQIFVGNTVPGSILGFKYDDVDANGIFDATIDEPLAGVIFQLTATLSDGTDVVRQAVTGDDGRFFFDDLIPSVNGQGDATGYTLTELPRLGYFSTTIDEAFFNVSAGQYYVFQVGLATFDPDVDDALETEIVTPNRLIYGNTAEGSIHGFKFEDVNGDGVYQPAQGELPLAGVGFTLTGVNGFGQTISISIPTNDDGEFAYFGLVPSIAGQPSAIEGLLQTGYTVTETLPEGFLPTVPFGAPTIERLFNLGSGEELVWRDGAATLPPAPTPVSFGVPLPDGVDEAGLAASGNIVALQSFTPAQTGTLTSLQIPVTTTNDFEGDVTVTLHTTDALGNPTATVLETVVVSIGPTTGTLTQTLDFAFNTLLAAGERYVFAINGAADPAGNPLASLSVFDVFDSPYTDGDAFQTNVGFLPDGPFTDLDVVFTATILPQADPRNEFLDDLTFGNIRPGEIHGFKFNDLDGNGIVDAGEPRLNGVTIVLSDINGNQVNDIFGNPLLPVQTTSMDLNNDGDDTDPGESGLYWFENLLPGTYLVREVTQTGFVQTTHDPQPIVINRGEVYEAVAGLAMLDRDDVRDRIVDKCLIFGNVQTVSIEGYKFNDINGNGIDNADPRLAGVTITLTGDVNNDGAVDTLTTLTGADGVYRFDGLFPGTYTITETPPTGSVLTTNLPVTITLAAGQSATVPTNVNLAIGNAYLGAIHGYKFEDVNGDGIDNGEPRLGGVIITLVGDVDGDGNSDTLTATTDNNGEYWFTELFPGQYTVTETVPGGSVATTATTANVTLTSGEVEVGLAGQGSSMGPLLIGQFEQTPNNALRFGNQFLGEIHGIKFEDLDADGVFDANENGLAGFVIELTDANGTVIDTETTDADGNYWFLNLPAGTYFVREVQQSGYAQTTHDPQPISITRGQIYVGRGDLEMTGPDDQREIIVDKCLLIGNTIQSSIHGFKFLDNDRNGIGDRDIDVVQPGVTFNLTTATGAAVIDLSGNLVGPSVTDGSGNFQFTNLRPGNYIVTEVVPAGQQPTTGAIARPFTVGYGQELVSFPTQAELPAGDPRVEVVLDVALDWGNAPLLGAIHGHKFSDLDGDGIEDGQDIRLNGWTITLTDTAGNAVIDGFGNPVLPTQTANMDLNGDGQITPNEQGLYWFENLVPGTYIVREFDQAGYEQTSLSAQPITITGGQVFVAQLDQAKTNPALDFDDATTDDGFEEARPIIVDNRLAFGNQLRGEITWQKETKDGLLGGVIFTLTRTHEYDLATGNLINVPDMAITVADNLTPDVNSTFGLFEVHDLPLGRYTLVESFPVPGYDPDNTVVTFDLYPQESLNDRFQASPHVFFNTWSKRAFVGSTYAARLAYLESIAQAEVENVNGGLFEFLGLPNNGNGGGNGGGGGGGGDVGGGFGGEPFRVNLMLAESVDTIDLTHQTSGNVVGQGELISGFEAMTTDFNEYLTVSPMSRMSGPLQISSAGGDDVIDIANFDFQSLDGGAGYDVLRLRESGELSLGSAASRISHIEEIALAGENQRVAISPDLVRRLTGDSPLTIQHQSSDQLRMTGGWRLESVVDENGRAVQIARAGDATLRLINEHRYQNSVDRFDVNGSGTVTALDALVGINRLNAMAGDTTLPADGLPTNFYDVNGDGRVSAIDALQVINRLNQAMISPEPMFVASGEPIMNVTPSGDTPTIAAARTRDLAVGSFDKLDDLVDQFDLADAREDVKTVAGDAAFDRVTDTASPWIATASVTDLGSNQAGEDDNAMDAMLELLATDGGRG